MTFVAGPSFLCLMALISIVAGAAKGLTGFGGALVMAPLFSLMLPANTAGALVVMVHCATSMQGIRRWRRETRWIAVMPLGITAITLTAVGTHYLSDPAGVIGEHTQVARRLVGVVVLLVTAAHISGWRWQHTGGWWPTITAGAISGTLTALGGLGGPPAVYYFNAVAQGATLRANLLGYFALLFGGAALLLLIEGHISSGLLATAVVLIPPFAVGVLLGERYSLTMSRRFVERSVSTLLLASGLVAMFS